MESYPGLLAYAQTTPKLQRIKYVGLDPVLVFIDSENWSIRRIGTQYGVSGLLGVGSKNKIFPNFLKLVWIRRIEPPGYGVSDLLDMVYQTYWVRRIELIRYDVLGSLGMVYWLFGYGELAKNVLLMVFDQSIIYDVSADVDTAYSSKSSNGLEFFKVIRYDVCFKTRPFLRLLPNAR
ncbi:hypothetical protein Tco_0967333 [Tanacetum coccineum]